MQVTEWLVEVPAANDNQISIFHAYGLSDGFSHCPL
jgi:hypothetical protein